MFNHDYSVFLELIKKYQSDEFQGISREVPFIVELEEMLKSHKQSFHILDLIRVQMLYVSPAIENLIGVEPDKFDPSVMFDKLHPEDLMRYHLARTKYIKIGQDLLLKGGGFRIISSNFRVMNCSGNYCNMLFQGYIFYSEHPRKTVYSLMSLTDISRLEKGKHAYHYYYGDDIANFRYPDKKLLELGRVFSSREYDILKLIAEGLDSEQIAEKLFLSVNTINTHRRNLLKKTNKSTTHELVIELKEGGIL